MNTALEEVKYAKKWEEIWKGDKRTKAYKRLKRILEAGVTKKRTDYGTFWREK